MVHNLDTKIKNSKKYKNLLILVGALLIVLILSFGIYSIVYYQTKNKLETKFQEALKENNFKKTKTGRYQLQSSKNLTFSVPNQKMPNLLSFDLDLNLTNIYLDIKLENEDRVEGIFTDINTYQFERYNKKDDLISTIKNNTKEAINLEKASEKLSIKKENLIKIIKKANDLYKDFY